jgi:hypothetical protein
MRSPSSMPCGCVRLSAASTVACTAVALAASLLPCTYVCTVNWLGIERRRAGERRAQTRLAVDALHGAVAVDNVEARAIDRQQLGGVAVGQRTGQSLALLTMARSVALRIWSKRAPNGAGDMYARRNVSSSSDSLSL